MPVKLLNDELNKQIKDLFDTKLIHPVELLYFVNRDQCETCDDTKQLLEEITSISDLLSLSNFDLGEHPQIAQKYNAQLASGLVIAGRDQEKILDYGIRFAGIPSGYEFSSLLQAILLVSTRDSGLKPAVRNQLKDIRKPIQLRVFVTPT